MDRPENPLVQTLDSDKNSPKIAILPSAPIPSHGQRSILQPQQPPAAYADRPRRSRSVEWPYDVPFMYRLLMSGDPQPCASLVSDGMEDEEPAARPGCMRSAACSNLRACGALPISSAPPWRRRRLPAPVHGGRRRVAAGVLHGPREADVLAASDAARTPVPASPPLPPRTSCWPRWTKRWPFSTPIATAICCWRPSSWTSCPTPAKPS